MSEWLEQGLVGDAVIAASLRQAQAMWTIREGLAIDALPNLVNFDANAKPGTGSGARNASRCNKIRAPRDASATEVAQVWPTAE